MIYPLVYPSLVILHRKRKLAPVLLVPFFLRCHLVLIISFFGLLKITKKGKYREEITCITTRSCIVTKEISTIKKWIALFFWEIICIGMSKNRKSSII